MRSGSGASMLLNKDKGMSKWDGSSFESAGGLTSSLMRRRMALAWRRILEISCWAVLGHRWRGRVLLAGARVDLLGNIDADESIASP